MAEDRVFASPPSFQQQEKVVIGFGLFSDLLNRGIELLDLGVFFGVHLAEANDVCGAEDLGGNAAAGFDHDGCADEGYLGVAESGDAGLAWFARLALVWGHEVVVVKELGH